MPSLNTGPSRNIDQSHHETSYGNYNNKGYHASGRGKFTIHQKTTNYHHSPWNPLEELDKHCSHTAAFDSSARFDPPRCAESTRLRIIQMIEEWISSEGDTTVPSSLFWLHGGAGVGKSALAQSLSEQFQKKRRLAASFFFFRSDASRNDGGHLIPTLVSHFLDSFEGIVPFVEDRIRQNRPVIFKKKYEIQIQELLIEPLLALKLKRPLVTHPQLIVIDGLDECDDPNVQCGLLRAIASAIPHIPYPLRFLITSRPEAHITRVFNHDPDLQVITVRRYNLSDDPDADRDIRKFLEGEFVEIRRVHCLGKHLPDTWPNGKAIKSLVERSSGHFVYASTVIRYVRSPKHRPDDRLEVVLRLRSPRRLDRPYAQLDALYTFIFQGVESHDQLQEICLFLGILYFQSKQVGVFVDLRSDCTTIEGLLGMKAGDLVLLLDPVLSLIAIENDKVRILHKSLFDFLLDPTRGANLPLDLAQVHEVAANYVLKQRITKGVCDLEDFRRFAYHCQYARLNDTLKDYLRSLEVPFPASVMRTFPPPDSSLNECLLRTVWHFFRTLSREDFDSTGQAHEQYAAKWIRFLPGRTRRRIRVVVAKVERLKFWLKHIVLTAESKPKTFVTVAELDNIKRQIDGLLMEWKPPNFNPMDRKVDSDRLVAFIKRDRSVFSAYAKAFFSGDAVISSLVLGDYFIYSYEVVVVAASSYLRLRIYSRHGNTWYKFPISGIRDIVSEVQGGLWSVGKHLFSDLFQKYGLEPDEGTVT